MIKIDGLCVHGLMGDVYSLGMDALASKLNRATPEGVHFEVVGGNNPDLEAGNLTRRLLASAAKGIAPVVIGHSLGGDFVWDFADKANAAGVALPLMVSIDPVQWRGNRGVAGMWVAAKCVDVAMNFRQPFYPGGGRLTAADKRTLVQEHTYSYPHANFGQALAMDTAADIHASILGAVMALARDPR